MLRNKKLCFFISQHLQKIKKQSFFIFCNVYYKYNTKEEENNFKVLAIEFKILK